MTTAPQTTATGSRRGAAGRALVRALIATTALGAVLAVVAHIASGRPAALGVLVGMAMVCGFFGFGAFVLLWITQASPALSLLVGLLTYTLQVVVLGLVFATLQDSALLGPTIDAGWLGSTVVAGSVAWLAIQVTLSLRTRQTYFDVAAPAAGSDSAHPSKTPSPASRVSSSGPASVASERAEGNAP